MGQTAELEPLIVLGREQLESVRRWIETELVVCNNHIRSSMIVDPPNYTRLTQEAQKKRVLRYYRARLIRAERQAVKEHGPVSSANAGR